MRDAQHEALEKLKREVGPGDPKKHAGGYLSADEVATLVYYWAAGGEEHGPNEADGIVAAVAQFGLGTDWTLRRAGIVMALCELYPDRENGWRSAHPDLFKSIRRSMESPKHDKRWNIFHLVQWFILRKARPDEGIDILDKLLDRVAEGGEVGYDALQVIAGAAKGCKPFEVCMERARGPLW